MENFDLLNNDLQVTPQGQSYLTESAKWGKFLAIIGFIFCGFMVVLAFIIPALMAQLSQNSSSAGVTFSFTPAIRTAMTVLYLMLAFLFFFPCYYLYKFSAKMNLAAKNINQDNFDESLMNLKSMFKFFGIFTIIILSIYALAVIIGIIGAATH